MALTVNLKPSGFQPVGGSELIYKFTEASIAGKPNYRVELEFNGLSLPKFEFRPDANLVIECDIAKILRSKLVLSALTTDRLKNTYVKYQAVWTGSSDAQVPLSSDVIYFYIGNNHFLNSRTVFHITSANNGPFLFSNNGNEKPIRAWVNRPIAFDFLHDDSLDASSKVTATDLSGYDFTGNVFAMESAVFTWTTPGLKYIQVTDGASTAYTITYPVMVEEECQNPVYLQWLNDYGGLQRWMFDFNQDLTLNPDKDAKYLFKQMFTNGLTYHEWLIINELYREGQIYNDERRIGQFVQDITGSTTYDVIITPDAKSRGTKQLKTQLDVIARYPGIPNSEMT